MKSITIVGNLGAQAIVRTCTDGRQIMTFNVAVSAGKETIWFNCVSNHRENLLPYLVKGQCVCVVGDLTPATYQGRLDLTVNVDRLELCGAKPKEDAPVSSDNPQPEVY